MIKQAGCSCLPAGQEAGSATRAAVRAAAKDVTAGDKLDPKRTVALVVRGGTGLAKCIQAALLRTGRCRGESRQLEDHPRAAVQFLHAEVQGRPFGRHLDLGTRSYVGCSSDGKSLPLRLRTTGGPAFAGVPRNPTLGPTATRAPPLPAPAPPPGAAATAAPPLPPGAAAAGAPPLPPPGPAPAPRPPPPAARQQSCARRRPCTRQRSRWA